MNDVTPVEDRLPVELENAKMRAQAMISAGGARTIAGLQLSNTERTTRLFEELVGKAREAEPGESQLGLYGLALKCSEITAKNLDVLFRFSKAISAAAIGTRQVESTFGRKLESNPILPPPVNVESPPPEVEVGKPQV